MLRFLHIWLWFDRKFQGSSLRSLFPIKLKPENVQVWLRVESRWWNSWGAGTVAGWPSHRWPSHRWPSWSHRYNISTRGSQYNVSNYFLTSEPNEHVFALRNFAGCRLNLTMILSLKVPLKVSTRMKQWKNHLNLSASWIKRLCNCLLMQDEFINSLSDYKLPFRCKLWILVKPDAPTKSIANSFPVSKLEFYSRVRSTDSVLIKMLLYIISYCIF